MKKIIALFMAVAMMVAVCSCGTNSSETETEATTTKAAEMNLVKEGTLTMATNAYFEPYEFYKDNKVVGIDAEIAQAIADKLGLKLEIQDMEFDSIITSVQEGGADIGLAGMTVTDERKKNVDFSSSYATGIQSIIVKEDSKITKVEDITKNNKIGVQLGTTGDIYAKDDFGADAVVEYNKGTDAVVALKGGDVDCVIIDNEPAKAYVAANEGLKILDTEYAVEEYAAAISKDNKALLDKVNVALEALIADGTVDKIVNKYISAK